MADELTLDQLHGIVTDPDTEVKVAQAAQLPVGTYNSIPELALQVREAGSEAKNPGRKFARYFGGFTGTGDVAGKTGKAGFNLSWEPRYKDDTGKPDLMTKLFYQAKKTYCLASGIDPKESVAVADVLGFVQKYAVAVRFLQGDEDNMAVAISQAREA